MTKGIDEPILWATEYYWNNIQHNDYPAVQRQDHISMGAFENPILGFVRANVNWARKRGVQEVYVISELPEVDKEYKELYDRVTREHKHISVQELMRKYGVKKFSGVNY